MIRIGQFMTGIIFLTTVNLSFAQEQIDVNEKIHVLESQIQLMMEELQELKEEVAKNDQEKQEWQTRIANLENETNEDYKDHITKNMKDEKKYTLMNALGIEEDSGINIGGEIVMRYRENEKTDAGSNGFQFYELELFIDAAVHKNVSIYAEYNLVHDGNAEPEDIWIDIHTEEGPLAFNGGTGLKIGNFHYPFGWDNDDEEGYVYGGRTSVNNSLVRAQRIDGWRLRERQVGLAAYYNFDPSRDLNLSTVVGIFNGNGDANHSGSTDNDREKDFAVRTEAKFKDTVIGMSYLFAPYTRNIISNANNTAHVRDIRRYGVHFKYPDVPFPGQDISIGGKPMLVWGEFIWGDHDGNNNYQGIISGADDSLHMRGGYIEVDVALTPNLFGFKPNPMLAFLRYDYYEPNTKISDDDSWAVTPGVRIPILNSSVLVLQYEIYGGGDAAPKSIVDSDRFAAQLTTQF